MKCPKCKATIEPNDYRNIYRCPECDRMFTLSGTLTSIPITKSNIMCSEPVGIYIYRVGRGPELEIPIYARIDSFNKYKDLIEEVAKVERLIADKKYLISTINIIYF